MTVPDEYNTKQTLNSSQPELHWTFNKNSQKNPWHSSFLTKLQAWILELYWKSAL